MAHDFSERHDDELRYDDYVTPCSRKGELYDEINRRRSPISRSLGRAASLLSSSDILGQVMDVMRNPFNKTKENDDVSTD